jgi:hypothetical protein
MILRQSFEGLVEGDHVQALLIEAGQDLVQWDSDAIPATLPGVATPGVIDKDLAHRLGGGGEEVAAVGDVGQGVAVEEPQQGLMDQGAGLEGVAGPLAAHQPAGRAPQLGVDGPDEPLPGVSAAGASLVEDGRQVTRFFGAQGFPLNSFEIGLGDPPRLSHAEEAGGSSC